MLRLLDSSKGVFGDCSVLISELLELLISTVMMGAEDE